MEQGFLRKAVTVYKSVLKLTPGLPHVRERLAEAYRQLGMVADALRELELAANELQQPGTTERGAAGAAQDRRAAPGQRRRRASSWPRRRRRSARSTRRSTSCRQPAEQLKAQGRADEFVRVAERLLFHRPDNFAVARELAAAYIAAQQPAAGAGQAAGAAEGGAARSAERHAARRGAGAARSAEGDVGLARAGRDARRRRAARTSATPRCARRWRSIRTDGETRELAARWGVAGQRRASARGVDARRRCRSRASAAPRPLPRADGAPGADRSGPVVGLAGAALGHLGASRALGLTPGRARSGASSRRPTCS